MVHGGAYITVRWYSILAMSQQIIDLAISHFLQTNDAAARQYLIHRQNVLEIGQKVKSEVQENGDVLPATKLRLQQLQFENTKLNVLYKAHVAKLRENTGFFEQQGVSGNLAAEMDEISAKNDALVHEVETMALTHKPVVEKLSQLVKSFESAVTIKSSRARKTAGDFVASAVFSRPELEALFEGVTAKLASLRTVDEIKAGGETAQKETIDVSRHLGELLQNSRAYTRLEDGKFRYDISKSTSVDIGNASMSIQEYTHALDILVSDIQDLVERGTEAKERWVLNARKIEAMQALLADAMETD